jgi:exonuclease III
MRIVSWNCGYGFDKIKSDAISRFDADILVVQECRKNEWDTFYPLGIHSDWYGSDNLMYNSDCQYHQPGIFFGRDSHVYGGQDKGQGIGLFSNKYQFKLLGELVYDYAHRYVIPYAVSGDGKEFTLVVVYYIGNALECDIFDTLTVEHINKVIEFYKNLLKEPVIVMGDFNSTEIVNVRKELEKVNVFDCSQKISGISTPTYRYATFNGQKEEVTTNCCFATKDMFGKVSHFEIDTWKEWEQYSDHYPMIVDFKT